jgi:hypothetical protein
MLLPSSQSTDKPQNKPAISSQLLGLFTDPEDGSSMLVGFKQITQY